MPIFDNILKTVGRTPIVRVNKMGPPHVNMFVKCESFNPLSSVKDRLAHAVVEDAERRGLLRPGMTVVEATSGSTGIGLAMVCAVKGYPLVCVTRASFCMEVRQLMKFLGAKVVLLPQEFSPKEMKEYAFMLAEENGWFVTRQFENKANAKYHKETTGREILDDFAHRPLDYFVSGYGTGGTISGAGAAIKEERPECEVVIVEPEVAQLLKGKKWNPHGIQGWSPNYLPENLDVHVYDRHLAVTDADARRRSQELACHEGIMVGISGGATMPAALEVADTALPGSNIVAMMPDSAERYLSTPLFDHISAESDVVPNMVPFDEFLDRRARIPKSY